MKKENTFKFALKLTCVSLVTFGLSACGVTAERLAQIGKEPPLAKIENPVTQPDYQPVSIPLPEPVNVVQQPNSLWQANRQTFFKDQRANNVGDILTVMVEINDEAELENETERTRSGSEDVDLPSLLGLAGEIANALPGQVDPADLINIASSSVTNGEGSIEREEEISLQLAAMITQVLPNGNLVIYGRQQVRVNFELREIKVAGIIRPEDIQANNSIPYERIAEARISYGGKGHISDVQKPRYGQEFLDVVFPF